MKRFSLREFLLLCLPVAVVGAGLLAVQLRHPPRDPEAKIALNVTSSADETDTLFDGTRTIEECQLNLENESQIL